ncbi:MAG: GNAT family N-acetyltransferase, partial [Sphingosinicella sp.]
AVELDRLPADSPLIPALRTAMRGRGLVSIRRARSGPTVRLDSGWQQPESRINSGRRSDGRRAARKAAALGEVSYEILSPCAHEFDALFDEAAAVELRSWKAEAATAISSDRAKELFFRCFFRRACEQGTFRLALLRIGGEIAAMQMGLETLGRFWLFKIGFDERFGHCSPGNLLMLHSIGWAAGRGLVSYELLGSTEAWITTFWTREQHLYVKLRTYPFGLRGGVALLADSLAWLWHGLVRQGR